MGKKYETFNHAKAHIRYHIIFSTKYRRDCLAGIEDSLTQCFNDIASRSNFRILEIGIDRNHVHLFVKSCPTFTVLQIVRRLKQVSTRRMWGAHEEHLSRFYRKKRVLWSNGYFCSTVGEMSEETIKNYIKNQG